MTAFLEVTPSRNRKQCFAYIISSEPSTTPSHLPPRYQCRISHSQTRMQALYQLQIDLLRSAQGDVACAIENPANSPCRFRILIIGRVILSPSTTHSFMNVVFSLAQGNCHLSTLYSRLLSRYTLCYRYTSTTQRHLGRPSSLCQYRPRHHPT